MTSSTFKIGEGAKMARDFTFHPKWTAPQPPQTEMSESARQTLGRTPTPAHHRTLFLSDFHLGARGCAAEAIFAFLQKNDADTIYLVGDILDIWHPVMAHWSPVHDAILADLLGRAQSGVRVIYLPGNHDHALRRHYGLHLGCIEVMEQAIHTAQDGRRYLVLHGDVADGRILRSHIMTRIGSRLDALLRALDGRLKDGSGEPTVIARLLARYNSMLQFGDRYRDKLLKRAADAGADGVICGHSHIAALQDCGGKIYANCGDWVDSHTAIAERVDGGLHLLAPQFLPPLGESSRASEPHHAPLPDSV
jgi:UDP-2,3-diacylglucosamine pyrophosphatase LpxH